MPLKYINRVVVKVLPKHLPTGQVQDCAEWLVALLGSFLEQKRHLSPYARFYCEELDYELVQQHFDYHKKLLLWWRNTQFCLQSLNPKVFLLKFVPNFCILPLCWTWPLLAACRTTMKWDLDTRKRLHQRWIVYHQIRMPSQHHKGLL